MAGTAGLSTNGSARENIRDYFREIVESRNLPSLPLVASKVLDLIQDPDVNVQKLCRVLSDDAALAGRILAVSRSPNYAQRNLPTTLLGAIQVLGFRTIRSVVVANSMSSLCIYGDTVSEKLWSHSLAVALATRILAKQAGMRDGDQAFLAGLLHDVGEMIIVHGDPGGFARLALEAQRTGSQMVDVEQAAYGLDHTLIGMTLLDAWNLDSQISRAVLNHHSDVSGDDTNRLAETIALADYFSVKAGLGFFGEIPTPAAASMAKCRCETDEEVAQTVQAIREAYDEESALFRPA